jgi:hypothetical protein
MYMHTKNIFTSQSITKVIYCKGEPGSRLVVPDVSCYYYFMLEVRVCYVVFAFICGCWLDCDFQSDALYFLNAMPGT